MEQRRLYRLVERERRELWTRFKAGESLRQIARGLSRNSSSIGDIVKARGGVAPLPGTRATRTLSLNEREAISRGLSAGHSYRQIAAQLERAVSTISREVARHHGRDRYRAVRADERAWASAKRPKTCSWPCMLPYAG